MGFEIGVKIVTSLSYHQLTRSVTRTVPDFARNLANRPKLANTIATLL